MTAQELFDKISAEVKKQGILLNPDKEFTMGLLEGILTNRERYGDDYCPCRLVSGDKDIDRDIICPCVFRDPDIDDFGQCFCALFVNQAWVDKGEEKQIPDRWQPEAMVAHEETTTPVVMATGMNAEDHHHVRLTIGGVTVWWCTVCGYLALRAKPPQVCPVCAAKRDRFKPVKIAMFE